MSDTSSLAPSRPHTPVGQTPLALPTARPYRFTWDPSSRRPGPESVSGTTEGRGGDDFAATPHPFGFLNHSTASLALGSIPPEWSSSRTGFHGRVYDYKQHPYVNHHAQLYRLFSITRISVKLLPRHILHCPLLLQFRYLAFVERTSKLTCRQYLRNGNVMRKIPS